MRIVLVYLYGTNSRTTWRDRRVKGVPIKGLLRGRPLKVDHGRLADDRADYLHNVGVFWYQNTAF